jgi:hypothetical protein
MRLALVAVVIWGCSLSASLAHAGGGGFLIPPVEVDMGIGAPVGPAIDHVGPSTEILAGLHWASLAWKPTRFDVGFGYVGSFRAIDRDGIRAFRGDPMSQTDQLHLNGGYLTLGTTIASQKHWRTWFSARGELLHANDGEQTWSALGGALRISTEVYASTLSGGHNSGVCGTVAIGLYAEATYREVPVDLGPHGFTTGVTVRLPFLFAGS